MIRFTTKNSKYEVTIRDNHFHIKKYEATNPKSTYNAVGQTRISAQLHLEVGYPASFEGWSTSEVLNIEDV
jgi:hypothetical protein